MSPRNGVAGLSLLLAVGCASAPEPALLAAKPVASAPPTVSAFVDPDAPCMKKPDYRAFDFFAGEWIAYDGDNERTGADSVVIGEGGCALFEYWKPDVLDGGDGGVSISFFDPLTGLWRQIWTSPEVQVHIAGKVIDGVMKMEGEVFHHETDRRANYRSSWTLQQDGSVVQTAEEYDADNEEWVDWGVTTYRRKS
jgi:hypothetical protein